MLKNTRLLAAVVSTLLLTVLLFSSPAWASFISEIPVDCPVCGKHFIFNTWGYPMSKTTFGSYLDFQEQSSLETYYECMIASCPVCHFSGTLPDYTRKLPPDIKKKVREKLTPVNKGQALDDITECDYAAWIYIWEHRANKEIANVYLIASYLLRGSTGERDVQRKQFQALACGYFMKALAANEFTPQEQGIISYLVAELYRRRGKFDMALSWYARAQACSDNPDWIKSVIAGQMKLARNQDANNDI